ncbi:S8 family serine peptidase [candidate division TA06 bacterium]|nr:S8 family serine peptidase [candidate division TA06 bacterium]
MSIYIVRPRETLAARSIVLISRKFTSASRQSQIEEVSSLRMEDPVDQGIRRWLSDSQSRGVIHISKKKSYTKITGTTIVEMPDEEAERLRRDFPDALVLRDQQIELIRPRRSISSAKHKIKAPDLWHLRAIGIEAARKNGYKGSGRDVTIAELDTGVDPSHPELEGKIAGAYTFDVNQWEAQPMTPSQDTEGHGTHVAGLICGNKVGVAPGVKVLSGVMIPGGYGNLSDFILALEWAGTQPEVKIVCMSAGIRGYLPEMREVVADLLTVGVLPVFATGNEGRNRTRSPGNYNEVVSVGAINRKNRVASFSSGGTLIADNHQYVVPDLVAPGVDVYSSVMGGGYEAWDGTSMATPIVSGIAALILEKYPDISVTDLIDELLSTCKDLRQHEDRQGKGLVQIKAAR